MVKVVKVEDPAEQQYRSLSIAESCVFAVSENLLGGNSNLTRRSECELRREAEIERRSDYAEDAGRMSTDR